MSPWPITQSSKYVSAQLLSQLVTVICSFFAEAQRIAAEEYVPSIEDICHASERGVTDTHFNLDQLSMRVSQVYGQRGDRKKWIHLFEGVTSIIFCVPLSDYDEPGVPGKRARVCLLFPSARDIRYHKL